MILVDLAGADSDHCSIGGEDGHTLPQRKESMTINKSLMALKECIHGLSMSSHTTNTSFLNKTMITKTTTKASIPFRNSSLIQLLEEVLTPRINRDIDSVMVVNAGPENDSNKHNTSTILALINPITHIEGGVFNECNVLAHSNQLIYPKG